MDRITLIRDEPLNINDYVRKPTKMGPKLGVSLLSPLEKRPHFHPQG